MYFPLRNVAWMAFASSSEYAFPPSTADVAAHEPLIPFDSFFGESAHTPADTSARIKTPPMLRPFMLRLQLKKDHRRENRSHHSERQGDERIPGWQREPPRMD